MTDTQYLKIRGENADHDSGIDAVIINDSENKVSLFNFKYIENFEKSDKHFPSSEIDKILVFSRTRSSGHVEAKARISDRFWYAAEALTCSSRAATSVIRMPQR